MIFSNNVVCATSKTSDQPAHTRSLIRAFASRSVKLLTEHHLEFLSLKGAAQARVSVHLSKCYVVGNHKSRLYYLFVYVFVYLFELTITSGD